MSRIRFITLEGLLELKANGDKFTLVEVLSEESYHDKHIPGALNIPKAKVLEGDVEILGKHDRIIVYCANFKCEASTVAARKLIDLGFTDVWDFKGGKKAWEEAGLPLHQPAVV